MHKQNKKFYKIINNPANIAVFAAVCWSLFYTFNMTVAKTLNPCIQTTTLLFWRSIFGTLIFLPFVLSKGLRILKSEYIHIHIIRGILMTTAIFLTYTAYRNLPLTLATSIGFTAPLIMTILSLIFLKETISWRKWLIILLGYVGMLVIVRPGVVPLNIYVASSICANLSACVALILVKKIAHSDAPETIVFYPNLAMLLISGVLMIGFWQELSSIDLLQILLISALGALGQYSYAVAVKYAQSSFVAPFEYLRIVIAIPIGLYGFNEHLDLFMLAGVGIIISSTWMLSRLSKREIV